MANTRRFYIKCLVACLAFLVTVLVLQIYGITLWKGGTVSERIPLTAMEGTGFLTFEAHLEGRAILIALDTGANTTCFDKSLIEELQLTIIGNPGTTFRIHSGDIHVQLAHVKSFKIGKISFNGDFSFVDLSRPNMGIQYAGGTPIEGLLGADILAKWNAVINYHYSAI